MSCSPYAIYDVRHGALLPHTLTAPRDAATYFRHDADACRRHLCLYAYAAL